MTVVSFKPKAHFSILCQFLCLWQIYNINKIPTYGASLYTDTLIIVRYLMQLCCYVKLCNIGIKVQHVRSTAASFFRFAQSLLETSITVVYRIRASSWSIMIAMIHHDLPWSNAILPHKNRSWWIIFFLIMILSWFRFSIFIMI